MSYPCTPVVSIQRVDAGSARDRHRSWGVLVDADVVVAPPLDGFADPQVGFEVLLASRPADGSFMIERIAVQRIERYGLNANLDLAVLAFRLAVPSRHRAYLGTYDLAAFAAAFAGSPDAWAALVAGGVVPRDVLDRPLDALDPIVAEEQRRRRDGVEDHGYDQVVDLLQGWCCIFHICHNCFLCLPSADAQGRGASTPA
jgi:hypothetical protein